MRKIRVAVVDDHAIVRVGVKCMVQSFADLDFAGDYPDGDGAAAFVLNAKSDVTLLDIRMPHKDGVDVLSEILLVNPAAKVIMLTTVGTEEDVYRAIRLGAKGYVMKDGATEKIVDAIRVVAAGGEYIPEDIRAIYAARQTRQELTERELVALKALAEGRSNREIGAKMGISEDGVKAHLRHISEKLGTKDRVETVAVAIRRGIIQVHVL